MSLQTRFDQLEDDISLKRESHKDWILQPTNEWPTDDDYLYDTVPITFDTFQEGTRWSSKRNPENVAKDLYFALGLAGETGECVDEIKKLYRNDNGLLGEKRKEKILEEAGDVLFYLAGLLDSVGIKLSSVAVANQKKMLVRLKEWNEKSSTG